MYLYYTVTIRSLYGLDVTIYKYYTWDGITFYEYRLFDDGNKKYTNTKTTYYMRVAYDNISGWRFKGKSFLDASVVHSIRKKIILVLLRRGLYPDIIKKVLQYLPYLDVNLTIISGGN